MELASREIGVPGFKLERRRERAEAALEGALKGREADSEGSELAAALQRIGELSMENELLRAKLGQSPGPLARKRWRWWPARPLPPPAVLTASRGSVQSGTAALVLCTARRAPEHPGPARAKGRRGPRPTVPDAALLAAIRADLARSPWSGEVHRKVWARLRVQDGLRVAQLGACCG